MFKTNDEKLEELRVRRFADIQEEMYFRAVWRWAILESKLLTALPRPSSWIRGGLLLREGMEGPTSKWKGREGKEEKVKEGEGKGRRGGRGEPTFKAGSGRGGEKMEMRGREGKEGWGGEGAPGMNFWLRL